MSNIEAQEGPPAGSLTKGYSVGKGMGVNTQTNETRASLLGASGLGSSMRSPVTKSFRRNKQGGFDKVGDVNKGVEEIIVITSSRPGNAAALVGQALGEEPEEVGHFLCIPLTNNVKALFVMMVMFAVISFAQYFAATAARSQSLKADVVSMGMDAVSYFGNIIGESSDIPAQRVVLQLFFSLLSLVLLNYFNTTIMLESIEILKESNAKANGEDSGGDGEDEGEGVEGKIVIAFAGLGLLFDAVCLYAYWYYAKMDADIEYNEMMKVAEAEGKDLNEAKASIKKPEINMLTALLHVSADLFRSTTTFVEGCLLLTGNLTADRQARLDSIIGLLIAGSIYLGSIYAVFEWWTSFHTWYVGLGNAIEVLCPACNETIEIKPDKAGHGKAADAFLG